MDGVMREAGYLFKHTTNATQLEKNLVKREGALSREGCRWSCECENFDSRSKVFDDILAALRDGNVTRVGIHGMPGVGKTTMMEQVKRALVEKKESEEVAVAVVSATLEIKSIQRMLANDLGLSDLAKEDDESVRAGLLRHRLKNGKKMLVILDDVWCKLPLEDVGIDFGDSRAAKFS
ncbi:hypothetical protein RJ639_020342 [Escallonia herrerae]|uniref:NB-ARC domain-containing protein n=1 Tax=Escallonia herrerae TaxID=1293975 RepID=A0AA89AEH4_9ASTE|nr:hypothetical protein RJ639_020342 [Escallonia herrerae]